MKKSIMFHHITIKQNIEPFKSRPVIFQCVVLMVSQLYDQSQKYICL